MTSAIYLRRIGKNSLPPLVMLHGWGWHSGIWKCLTTELSQHYHLYLIDIPGFGHSNLELPTYHFANIVNLLFPLLPTEATWLGWSLGGLIAWWVAIHHPEKISRLITVASTPKFIKDNTWPGVPEHVLEKFSQSLLYQYDQTITDFLTLQLRGNPNQKILFSELQAELLTTPKPKLSALVGGLQLLRETDLRPDIDKVKCPSLHIFGSLDTLVPVKVASLLPNAQCKIIQRVGHMPFLSQHEFLTAVLAAEL
jgi:pimeloyl-[acyl-carrier protein] methyl ester esterase